MTKVNVFKKVCQISRSGSLVQKYLYGVTGLVVGNPHVKYESSMSHGCEVMTIPFGLSFFRHFWDIIFHSFQLLSLAKDN